MKRKAALLCSFLALALASACSILGPDDVRIRVRNTGTVDFESALVTFTRQSEQYGPLAAGRASSYREVGKAYSYAYVEVIAGGARFVLQPIDFVGEETLKGGSYTYELSLGPTSSQLTQRMVRD